MKFGVVQQLLDAGASPEEINRVLVGLYVEVLQRGSTVDCYEITPEMGRESVKMLLFGTYDLPEFVA